jgi:CHASE2 domain-containing sensor protein
VLSTAVCFTAYVSTRSTLLTDFEYRGYDLLVNAGGYTAPDDRLIMVDFDDATLQRLGVYPIPRAMVADTIGAVAAGEPELIGVDLLLTEPRTPAEDAGMADAMRRAGNVLIAALHDSSQMLVANPLPQFCKRIRPCRPHATSSPPHSVSARSICRWTRTASCDASSCCRRRVPRCCRFPLRRRPTSPASR